MVRTNVVIDNVVRTNVVIDNVVRTNVVRYNVVGTKCQRFAITHLIISNVDWTKFVETKIAKNVIS